MTEIYISAAGMGLKTIPFPSGYTQCTQKQLLRIAKSLLAMANGSDSNTEMAELFKDLVEMAAKEHNISITRNWFQKVSHEDAGNAITDALQWIYNINGLGIQPFPGSTLVPAGKVVMLNASRNPYHLHGHLPQCYGVEQDGREIWSFGQTVTVGQYEDAEAIFNKIVSGQTEMADLIELAWILYGKYSQPVYNATAKPPKVFQTIPAEKLILVQMHFGALASNLPRLFPDLFNEGSGKSKPDPLAFTKCIHAGAGPQNGTREQVRKLPLIEFCFDLNLTAKQAKELQSNQPV